MEPVTTRRLRSLHIPSTPSESTGLSRRFNSLRRPTSVNNNNNHTESTTTATPSPLFTQRPITTEEVEEDTTEENQGHQERVHIKLVPNLGVSSRCFVFDVVERDLVKGGSALKLGRYSDRTVVSDRLSFKSKVVSRYHAEIWMSGEDGKIYIKDSGSSSGTFVNHIRLTAANTESAKPHEIMDGDLIQLGVDYKGGLEPMYRAVRMRLEVNRKWQEESSNTYSLSAFQQLRNQISQTQSNSEELQECCICLYCIAPFQALFIAPCSHVYHYRCLRPLLMQNYPGFSCPLCRAYSNLEASVAVEENEVLEMLGMTNNSEESSSHQREKTVFADDEQPSPLIRPSLLFQRQISSSDGIAATLVGSPPRFDAGGGGGGMVGELSFS